LKPSDFDETPKLAELDDPEFHSKGWNEIVAASLVKKVIVWAIEKDAEERPIVLKAGFSFNGNVNGLANTAVASRVCRQMGWTTTFPDGSVKKTKTFPPTGFIACLCDTRYKVNFSHIDWTATAEANGLTPTGEDQEDQDNGGEAVSA